MDDEIKYFKLWCYDCKRWADIRMSVDLEGKELAGVTSCSICKGKDTRWLFSFTGASKEGCIFVTGSRDE